MMDNFKNQLFLINQYLHYSDVCYLSVINHQRPVQIPITMRLFRYNTINFAIEKGSRAHQMIKEAPQVSIIAPASPTQTIIINGTVEFDQHNEYTKVILRRRLQLRSYYSELAGHELQWFHLTKITARLEDLFGQQFVIK